MENDTTAQATPTVKYTEDEIHGFGINKSLSHVDFMIGSKDLCITGITEDGKEVQIFRDGNWAI